jgi:cytochrome c oxidase subunit 2
MLATEQKLKALVVRNRIKDRGAVNVMPKSSTHPRHFIIVGVLVAIVTVLLGLLLESALPLPVQASIEALTIDWLFGLHMWLLAFLFALVVVFMLYAIVVFRKRDGDDSEGEHFEGSTSLEIAWTVIPLILVVIFAFIGFKTLIDITRQEPNEVVIKAHAQQWNWQFEYEGGVISDTLIVPLQHRVHIELDSKDVIHSFFVAEFRVKQDAVPGRPTHVDFTPIMTSEEYLATAKKGEKMEVRCAELCGLSHWQMIAPVRVVPANQFTAWLHREMVKVNPALTKTEPSKTSN